MKREAKVNEILAYLQLLEIKSPENDVKIEMILRKINPDFLYLLYFYLNELTFRTKHLVNPEDLNKKKSEILKSN